MQASTGTEKESWIGAIGKAMVTPNIKKFSYEDDD